MKRVLLIFLFLSSLSRAALTDEETEMMRVQIFLDANYYGPGVIDGRDGWVTRQAIAIFKNAHPDIDGDGESFESAVKRTVPEVVIYTAVPDIVDRFVNPSLPLEREAQAKEKSMNYRSIAEFMAERHHTTVDALIRMNNRDIVLGARAGTGMYVPTVKPFRVEEVQAQNFRYDDILSKREAYVDTKEKRITIYEFPDVEVYDGAPRPYKFIASFPITAGKSQFIRKGVWKMKSCVTMPDWRYDKKLLETGERGDEAFIIPPGPNNPVGLLWAGLSKDGIGVHGTSDPKTIGRSESAGCIRMTNWDVLRLPKLIRPGAKVIIR